MGKRTDTPFWSSSTQTSANEVDPPDQDFKSWISWLFPSRVERALLLAFYLVGALYLVLFKIIAIILIVIARSGGKA